jgi:hypothetical protein
VLHLTELVFPLAGELGAGECLRAELAELVDEIEALGGDDEISLLAFDVFVKDEPFDVTSSRASTSRVCACSPSVTGTRILPPPSPSLSSAALLP